MSPKKAAGCDLNRLSTASLGSALVCVHCGGRIPASAAITFEGSDYVRYFCGTDCLSEWCRNVSRRGD